MKTQPRLCIAFTCAGILAAGLPGLNAQQPGTLPPAAPEKPSTPPPLLPPADTKGPPPSQFAGKIITDNSPLPNNGQLQMSYATVVDRILPSVVTIYSSTPIKTPGVEQIPPQLRPFFYRFFGAPGGQDPFGGGMNEDDEPAPNPRGRNRGGQPQRPQPQQPAPDDESNQERGVGSGMIITPDGYIITNNHVVAEAKKIEVAVDNNGSTRTYKAEVIGTDPLTDVALIKIDATGLKPATLGDSSKLRVGDIVLAAGAPMELSRSVTQGIVSALGRSNEGIVKGRGGMAKGYEDFIQTDASINPGNSGGPLVDGMGRVIGISTAILSRTGMNAGIGFAIPINMALHIVEDLLDDGAVQRGFLGVEIQDMDPATAKLLQLEDQIGALVRRVGADSPAEKAGIKIEDVIIAINGQKIDSSSRLRLIVSGTKPGSQIPIEVMRGGQRLTVTATLEALPEEALSELSGGGPRGIPRQGSGAAPAKDNIGELVTGVTVQTLTPALRERHDIPDNVTGVIVTKLDPDSRAAARGVEENDVISHVNRKPIGNAAEARTLAKGSDKTVLLRVWRKGDTMLLMIPNN